MGNKLFGNVVKQPVYKLEYWTNELAHNLSKSIQVFLYNWLLHCLYVILYRIYIV